jgi:hypothetical protein
MDHFPKFVHVKFWPRLLGRSHDVRIREVCTRALFLRVPGGTDPGEGDPRT